jgi:hypothetical protein
VVRGVGKRTTFTNSCLSDIEHCKEQIKWSQ